MNAVELFSQGRHTRVKDIFSGIGNIPVTLNRDRLLFPESD